MAKVHKAHKATYSSKTLEEHAIHSTKMPESCRSEEEGHANPKSSKAKMQEDHMVKAHETPSAKAFKGRKQQTMHEEEPLDAKAEKGALSKAKTSKSKRRKRRHRTIESKCCVAMI